MCFFSLMMYTIITIYGRVKKSVMPLSIIWIFLLDLELNFIGKLLIFRWELIVLLLLQICFFFFMREISWSLSHVKIRLTVLRRSIQLQDTLMTVWSELYKFVFFLYERQKDCLWKQHTTDKKIGVSVLLRLFISSNEVCNTAYAVYIFCWKSVSYMELWLQTVWYIFFSRKVTKWVLVLCFHKMVC